MPKPRRTLLRLARWLFLSALVLTAGLTLPGCYRSMGRGIAAGATTELHARRDTLGIIAATVVDSAVSRAARSMVASIEYPFDSLFAALVDSLGARAQRQQTALTDQLALDLTGLVDTLFAESSHDLQDLFQTNAPALRDSVDAFIAQWMHTAAAAARESVVPLMAEAADSVTTRIVDRLSAALTGALRDDVIDLAFLVADTLQGRVQEPFLKLGQAATVATLGIFLLIVGAVAVLLIAVRRSRAALDIVTDAVHDWTVDQAQAAQVPGTPAPRHTSLAQAIEERARETHLDTRRLTRVIEVAHLLDQTGAHPVPSELGDPGEKAPG